MFVHVLLLYKVQYNYYKYKQIKPFSCCLSAVSCFLSFEMACNDPQSINNQKIM